MSKEYLVVTDKEEKIKLDSRIVYANWISEMAIGGEEAVLEVGTVFVAEGSKIEIIGASSAGKTPGKITGKIYNNKFVGKLPIPEKVQAGADVWFNVKLPKHGLKMESGTVIPGKPPVYATSIGWDRRTVKRDEIVTIKAQFEGVQDVAEATVVIYEYDPQGHHDKVISFPVEIVNRTLNCAWKFMYPDDTSQIPTQKEMEKYGLNYVNPSYFFVVLIDCFRVGVEQESGLLEFRDSVDFVLKNHYSMILRNYAVDVTLADGTIIQSKSDEQGSVHMVDVPPGPVKIDYELKPYLSLEVKIDKVCCSGHENVILRSTDTYKSYYQKIELGGSVLGNCYTVHFGGIDDSFCYSLEMSSASGEIMSTVFENVQYGNWNAKPGGING